jgi:hypothetical protein
LNSSESDCSEGGASRCQRLFGRLIAVRARIELFDKIRFVNSYTLVVRRERRESNLQMRNVDIAWAIGPKKVEGAWQLAKGA